MRVLIGRVEADLSAPAFTGFRWHKLERRGIDHIPGEAVTPTL
jgi:hypothetical protein